MDKNYDVITFVSKYFISWRPGVANFADIVKIAIMLIKTTYEESAYFNITNIATFWCKDADVSRILAVFDVI